MPRPDFAEGLPHHTLEARELSRLQTPYGNFAATILTGIRDIDRQAPLDILTVGDDWFQLVHTYLEPRNETEREIARLTGAAFFADSWPIKRRGPGVNAENLLNEIAAGVAVGTIDPRILDKIALLDASQDIAPLVEDNLLHPVDTPWGVNGILGTTNTLVYYIRSGFDRQGVIDIPHGPNDPITGRIMYPKGSKSL